MLDTHALIWYADGSPQLPVATRQLLDSPVVERLVSIVTFWELATLLNLKRLALQPNLATWFELVKSNDFQILPILDKHLVAYATLPQVRDHRDPFDRLLIAQALAEDLTLISRDGKFGAYAGLQVRWG
ncbi:type II toxin-antitoxin system VapC family toxin [Hymenobacter sp. H14-R3]|uniref:type II toxin-antitoxin system VapC family toxin n=1 Tax=Hymenobacter sp. H14-R3 TaxID=3046308 RepID=UPI0024BABE3A|nr:type II toxin-antitoxin system VapC family toxin [Hymenobacter sp. H14-R3]MDJ0364984.1 type II toxin-antitoxin system VapC family toxin [Hymenobacter sp. H14-R3]